MSRTYASPEAFKQALESHIRARAQQRAFPIGRMRQLFIAERLLVHCTRASEIASLRRVVWLWNCASTEPEPQRTWTFV